MMNNYSTIKNEYIRPFIIADNITDSSFNRIRRCSICVRSSKCDFQLFHFIPQPLNFFKPYWIVISFCFKQDNQLSLFD